MKNDLLACRHIGISEKDEEKMLRKIGVGSLDELIDKTIPANIRLKEPLALPAPMTEYEFGQHITRLACKNKLYTTYIGLGCITPLPPPLFNGMYSRIRYGTLLTPPTRQKFRKGASKR